MNTVVEKIQHEFLQELQQASNSQQIEALKLKFLGKKGVVQALMLQLKDFDAQQRPLAGKSINILKELISSHIEEKASAILAHERLERIENERIDISLSGRRRYPGRAHIVTHALREMVDILVAMGFSVQLGPDIETDYYNFEALNMGVDHPARDMQDTFYITDTILLRTHTSNIQARVMELYKPPIRIITPGLAFRNEDISARSHVLFHQVDAFYVDKGVTFADLMATYEQFLHHLFKRKIEIRFRPSYFPFVEPGIEIDMACLSCNGAGCQLCKHSGWLEICGAGMIHPEVLKNGGIDPEIYSGFAWGMGVERLLLLKYGIGDIRWLWDNDMRLLSQFPAL